MAGQQYKIIHRYSRRLPRPPWIASLTLVLLFVNLACSSITCGSGIKTPGVTIPKGDIVLEFNSHKPLEITCILDPDNEKVQQMLSDGNETFVQPSQNIQFFKNADLVPSDYVTIVNSTVARLFVPDPPAGTYTYTCTLLNHGSSDQVSNHDQSSTLSGGSSTFSTMQPTSLETSGPPPLMSGGSGIGVCLNLVTVGFKPLPITNFSCISYNWDSLRCNWTKPQNPVVTNYKVVFRLVAGRASRTVIKCPNEDDKDKNTCCWDGSTKEIYRKTYAYYNFTLIGKNSFGTTNTSFMFHHYGNVIPASPTNITVLNKTQSSAMLRWSVGLMYQFPPGLVHKIEYKSQWDSNPEHWHSVNISYVCSVSLTSDQINPTNCLLQDKEYYYFNVTDLKYPFTHYDFRIYVRSAVAYGEDKWSAPGRITLKTKPTIPRRPPRTDIGSFECVTSPVDKSTRDVYIYWQNIDDPEKCGDLFEYRAYYTSVTADNITINYRSNETYKNYAKFYALNTSVGYTFTVYSANSEGLSSEYSTVYVPSESNKPSEPLSFTKMAFNDRGIFELSWDNAKNQKFFNINQLVSGISYDYTIFWCESDKDRPYQCIGYMDWVHVKSSESCYNVTLVDHMKIYQFAISANKYFQPISSSSGMVWASCTVLHNKIIGKIKNVWVNKIDSKWMELRWKLECSDRIGEVVGYRIFYCPVVSINNSNCKETMLNTTEKTQDSSGTVRITNLKPYTTYKVTIALITKHGEGLHSDPLLNTTYEGAPDIQDLKINATNLTNTSVTLEWFPPKLPNGIIRYYSIDYYQSSNQPHQQDQPEESVDEQLSSKSPIRTNEPKLVLDHLESFIKYNITVTACTTICSNHSFPLQVQTAVGLPGKVPQPDVLYENSTRIIVSWARPMKPAGPIDYYELTVAYQSRSTNSQIKNGGSSPTALASKQIQENSKNFKYYSDSNVYRLPVPDCKDELDKGQQTFSFVVRAVNKNPHDPKNPYYGPWSSPGVVSCVLPGLPLLLHIVIWSCLFIVLSTVSTYWGNRFWRKYKIMHNVQVVLPPTLNVNFKFDHCNNFGDDSLDSNQQYYVEDGHIIYDGTPVDTVPFDGVKNSSTLVACKNSTDSLNNDRLPPTRCSPTTATTTIMVTDDDDSASSKHHLILPPALPKMNSERLGDTNSIKSSDGNIPPTEPVLPFFSLPDMPTTIPPMHNRLNGIGSNNFCLQDKAVGISRNKGCQEKVAVSSRNNGYQDGGFIFNVGYQDNGVGRTSGYQDNGVGRTSGYQDNRNISYSDGVGIKSNGYQDNGICSRIIGFKTDFKDNVSCAKTGYQDICEPYRNKDDCQPCDKTDYQDDKNSVESDQDCSIAPDADFKNCGSVSSNKGYQDSGFSSKNNDQDSGIVVMNTIYQDTEKKQPDEVMIDNECNAKDIIPAMSINCFIGNQQQLLNQNLKQLSGNLPADDVIQPLPSAVKTSSTKDSENDFEQKDEPPLCHLNDDPQQQQSPSTPPPQNSQPQIQQQNCLDGYCGKQMMIAAAAANEFGKNDDGDQLLPSDRYVMLDMMAAQKRLLDLGRLELAKPSATSVVQPVVAEISSNSCGTTLDQRDKNIEVTTQ